MKSETRNWLGRMAVNRRLTRSGARTAAGSELVVRLVLPRTTPAIPPGDPQGAHQPGDLVAADALTLALELAPELADPVDLVVVVEHLLELGVSSASRTARARRPPALGGVVGGRGDLQRTADRLDPEPVPIGIDVAVHLGRRPSSSAAKKADAVRRISLVRRSSRTSRSNAASLALSSVLVPDRWPPSISAWRTQLRRDSGPIPSCRAIRLTTPNRSPVCSIVSSTIRTAPDARSRSSGG